MIIPKTFNLFGQTYKVTLAKEIKHNDGEEIHDCNGLCLPDTTTITLCENVKRSKLEHIFLHELTHAILSEMGHELYHDEQFVNIFSNMLHQVLSSTKGEL